MAGGRVGLAAASKLAAIVALGLAAYGVLRVVQGFLPEELAWVYGVGKAVIVLVAGAAAANVLGNAVTASLLPTAREKAYGVGNTVKFVGFIFSAVAALYVGNVGAELAVLGGTVTGLVLGLALQPVLANLFAGILILATRFVEVGDTVRILAGGVPFQWAVLPPYKFFSAEHLPPGYKGRVVEVGLFFTTLAIDLGYEVRVPNAVLLNSAVLDHTPRWSSHLTVFVRVELPLAAVNHDTLQAEVRELLKDLNVVAVDYSEQSDKDHVILRVKLKVPMGSDWRAAKSEALRRLLKYREDLILKNFPKYSCLMRGQLCERLSPA